VKGSWSGLARENDESPETDRFDTITGSELELTSETVLLAEDPTFTEPKLTELGEAVKTP
jgi:hypothetical protein